VSLVRLATYDEMFRTGPVGHYAVGDQFLVWCSSPDLCGMVVWGQPAGADLQRVIEVFDHGEVTGIAVPCDFILDVRRLDRLDASVFEELVVQSGPRMADIARRVRQHAIVARPSELSNAVVSGFYALVGVALSWRIVDDHASALVWLGAPATDTAAIADVERALVEVLAGSPEVDRLQVWLRDKGLRATLEKAAAALGVSARSLQRRLGEAGTSFRTELERARLSAAQRLLLDGDEKVAVIADEVGSSSESNFIAFFRRLTGQTPAAWRAARRTSTPAE
jgi:AraC-like DNA-binding protein